MQIDDFLQKHLATNANVLITYEADICAHFDAYLRQLWPEGKVLVVTEMHRREYVERSLIPALKTNGYETLYCLCVKSAGVTYRAQIDESLGDGALENVVGIASVGSALLFSEVRSRASVLNIPCCALFDDFAPLDTFDACSDDESHPFADGIFFDLTAIAEKYKGDLRDPIQSLEVDVCAMRADLAAALAMSVRVNACIANALDEAVPPRIPQTGPVTEDDMAQLCEAYAWRAVAARLNRSQSSFQTVLEYADASPQFDSYPPTQHARLMAQIFDATLEIESLEISPEDCAAHQPPKDILKRTLQQILLQDEMRFDWLKRAEDSFMDRTTLRLALNELTSNWDDFCAKLRPIADVLRSISAQDEADDEQIDAALKSLWLHAAKFAPSYTFLKVFNDMRIVEPALYI